MASSKTALKRGSKNNQPLAGIRMIDLTRAWSGPFGMRLLADMGAEVIKVESNNSFDQARGTFPASPGDAIYPNNEPGDKPYNRSAHFNVLNRNKYGISLDIGKPRGKEIFKRLAAISDVVFNNFSAGVLDKLGLGYADLKKVKPDIIVVSMSGFGATGPECRYRAFGISLAQLSSVAHLMGYAGKPPLKSGLSPSDPVAGLFGASAVLLALRYRRKTGEGQEIDLAQLETASSLLANPLIDCVMNGRVHTRVGNRHPWLAPHGCYPCQGDDNWLVISISSDGEWGRFCKATTHPEWIADERFATVLGRKKNQVELDSLIGEWTVKHSNAEAMQLLQSVSVAAEAVQTIDELFSDPHLKARDFYHEVTHPEAGTHQYPGLEFELSETPGRLKMPAPCFAQHNDYIYRELLGLTQQEIAELTEAGVITTSPRPSEGE